VNFDHELAPLLGDTLVIATFGLPKSPRVLAILHTPDADAAKRVAKGIRNGDAVADGSTLVVELDGGHYERDGADDDALVRVLADKDAGPPGIRSAAFSFRLDSDAMRLHVRAHSDEPEQLAQVVGHGGLHRFPGTPAMAGLVGDRLVVEGDKVQLAPLGKPKSVLHTSGDLVEGDVTVAVPGGLD
jgi:hypothetical protein